MLVRINCSFREAFKMSYTIFLLPPTLRLSLGAKQLIITLFCCNELSLLEFYLKATHNSKYGEAVQIIPLTQNRTMNSRMIRRRPNLSASSPAEIRHLCSSYFVIYIYQDFLHLLQWLYSAHHGGIMVTYTFSILCRTSLYNNWYIRNIKYSMFILSNWPYIPSN